MSWLVTWSRRQCWSHSAGACGSGISIPSQPAMIVWGSGVASLIGHAYAASATCWNNNANNASQAKRSRSDRVRNWRNFIGVSRSTTLCHGERAPWSGFARNGPRTRTSLRSVLRTSPFGSATNSESSRDPAVSYWSRAVRRRLRAIRRDNSILSRLKPRSPARFVQPLSST